MVALLSIGADQAAIEVWQACLELDRSLSSRWLVAVAEAVRHKQQWSDRMTDALKDRWAMKREPLVALALYHHTAAQADPVASRAILEEAMQLPLRPSLRLQVLGAYVAGGIIDHRIEHVRREAYDLCKLVESVHHELVESIAWCAVTIDEHGRKDPRWRSSLQKFLRTAEANAYRRLLEENGVPLSGVPDRPGTK